MSPLLTAVLLLNGEPYPQKIESSNRYVICCDGAFRWAKGRVRIDENLGDFDSLDSPPDPLPRKIYPSEKDETDGELALDRALELGAKRILIYGGGGGREDHFLGNLHLLYKARLAGATATMFTCRAEITLCGEGRNRFSCPEGTTVSVVPFGGEAHIMETWGLKYPMRDLRLRYGSTRGISNVTENEEFGFAVKEGYVLVFVNKEGT